MLGPNSRLGQEIQRILKGHPDGLTPDDLEIELRQRGFQSSTPSIRKVLSHRDVFFPIAGGRYALRSIVEAAGDVEAEAPKVEKTQPRYRPKYEMLPTVQLPLTDLSSYIVFDIETTGLDHEKADIYQIAALKITNGHPNPQHATFYRYVQLDRDIPLVIQKKTHVTEEEFAQAVPYPIRVPAYRCIIRLFDGLHCRVVGHSRDACVWRLTIAYQVDRSVCSISLMRNGRLGRSKLRWGAGTR